MAQIDFDPDDYIDEIETCNLFAELKNRAKRGRLKDKKFYQEFVNEIFNEFSKEDILNEIADLNCFTIIQAEKLKEFLKQLKNDLT